MSDAALRRALAVSKDRNTSSEDSDSDATPTATIGLLKQLLAEKSGSGSRSCFSPQSSRKDSPQSSSKNSPGSSQTTDDVEDEQIAGETTKETARPKQPKNSTSGAEKEMKQVSDGGLPTDPDAKDEIPNSTAALQENSAFDILQYDPTKLSVASFPSYPDSVGDMSGAAPGRDTQGTSGALAATTSSGYPPGAEFLPEMPPTFDASVACAMDEQAAAAASVGEGSWHPPNSFAQDEEMVDVEELIQDYERELYGEYNKNPNEENSFADDHYNVASAEEYATDRVVVEYSAKEYNINAATEYDAEKYNNAATGFNEYDYGGAGVTTAAEPVAVAEAAATASWAAYAAHFSATGPAVSGSTDTASEMFVDSMGFHGFSEVESVPADGLFGGSWEHQSAARGVDRELDLYEDFSRPGVHPAEQQQVVVGNDRENQVGDPAELKPVGLDHKLHAVPDPEHPAGQQVGASTALQAAAVVTAGAAAGAAGSAADPNIAAASLQAPQPQPVSFTRVGQGHVLVHGGTTRKAHCGAAIGMQPQMHDFYNHPGVVIVGADSSSSSCSSSTATASAPGGPPALQPGDISGSCAAFPSYGGWEYKNHQEQPPRTTPHHNSATVGGGAGSLDQGKPSEGYYVLADALLAALGAGPHAAMCNAAGYHAKLHAGATAVGAAVDGHESSDDLVFHDLDESGEEEFLDPLEYTSCDEEGLPQAQKPAAVGEHANKGGQNSTVMAAAKLMQEDKNLRPEQDLRGTRLETGAEGMAQKTTDDHGSRTSSGAAAKQHYESTTTSERRCCRAQDDESTTTATLDDEDHVPSTQSAGQRADVGMFDRGAHNNTVGAAHPLPRKGLTRGARTLQDAERPRRPQAQLPPSSCPGSNPDRRRGDPEGGSVADNSNLFSSEEDDSATSDPPILRRDPHQRREDIATTAGCRRNVGGQSESLVDVLYALRDSMMQNTAPPPTNCPIQPGARPHHKRAPPPPPSQRPSGASLPAPEQQQFFGSRAAVAAQLAQTYLHNRQQRQAGLPAFPPTVSPTVQRGLLHQVPSINDEARPRSKNGEQWRDVLSAKDVREMADKIHHAAQGGRDVSDIELLHIVGALMQYCAAGDLAPPPSATDVSRACNSSIYESSGQDRFYNARGREQWQEGVQEQWQGRGKEQRFYQHHYQRTETRNTGGDHYNHRPSGRTGEGVRDERGNIIFPRKSKGFISDHHDEREKKPSDGWPDDADDWHNDEKLWGTRTCRNYRHSSEVHSSEDRFRSRRLLASRAAKLERQRQAQRGQLTEWEQNTLSPHRHEARERLFHHQGLWGGEDEEPGSGRPPQIRSNTRRDTSELNENDNDRELNEQSEDPLFGGDLRSPPRSRTHFEDDGEFGRDGLVDHVGASGYREDHDIPMRRLERRKPTCRAPHEVGDQEQGAASNSNQLQPAADEHEGEGRQRRSCNEEDEHNDDINHPGPTSSSCLDEEQEDLFRHFKFRRTKHFSIVADRLYADKKSPHLPRGPENCQQHPREDAAEGGNKEVNKEVELSGPRGKRTVYEKAPGGRKKVWVPVCNRQEDEPCHRERGSKSNAYNDNYVTGAFAGFEPRGRYDN
eukprot:CAMPEP_0178985642 /NCGR_PEP_ID=MMETSP0795-20121207/2263_1 /TAXON_ID=88552 /ORGANISM="Amoebophrya sp., Strain Ameob2" /LENGTH=1583 /DNA_ID=CAMNT_0020676617 /DNA_START=155 /DNA_END=4905 /DNA_ORIENTATION=+